MVLEMKRQFVRYISHEIRTPMNTVYLGTKLINLEMSRAMEEILATMQDLQDEREQHQQQPQQQEQQQQQQVLLLTTENLRGREANELSYEVNDSDQGRGRDVGSARGTSSARESLSLSQRRDQLREWLSLTADVIISSDSAISVLNDLINYDKLDTGKLTIEYEEVKIWEILRQVATQFTQQASHASVQLILDFQIDQQQYDNNHNKNHNHHHHSQYNAAVTEIRAAADLECGDHTTNNLNATTGVAGTAQRLENLVVIGESAKLEQALRNIISNAMKFTPSGDTVIIRGE